MGFFTPRYLKDASLLSEAAAKTLHQHRDQLKDGEITRLHSLIIALNGGIKVRDKAAVTRFPVTLKLGSQN